MAWRISTRDIISLGALVLAHSALTGNMNGVVLCVNSISTSLPYHVQRETSAKLFLLCVQFTLWRSSLNVHNCTSAADDWKKHLVTACNVDIWVKPWSLQDPLFIELFSRCFNWIVQGISVKLDLIIWISTLILCLIKIFRFYFTANCKYVYRE